MMTDSETAITERGFYYKTMGQVLGREVGCTPLADEKPTATATAERKAAKLTDATLDEAAFMQKNTGINANDDDYSWMLCLNSEYLNYKKCRCQGCLREFITFPSEKHHVERLFFAWTTLRALIRKVYLKPPLTRKESDPNILEEHEWIADVLKWLRLTEPYLLLQKIEDLVVAAVLDVRTRLLALMKQEQTNYLPGELFVTGLIEGYVKLLSSALYIAPVIEDLLSSQLHKFRLSWEMLNKYFYLSLIYMHEDVREMWPIGYQQMKKASESNDDYYQRLFGKFLLLDREMDLVDETWKVIEPVITEFRSLKSRENAALQRLQDALKARLSKKGTDAEDVHTCGRSEESCQFPAVPWLRIPPKDRPQSNIGDAERCSGGSRSTSSSCDGSDCECENWSSTHLTGAMLMDVFKETKNRFFNSHDRGKANKILNSEAVANDVGVKESKCEEQAKGSGKDDCEPLMSRNNPYLLNEFAHLYSVLSSGINAESQSLILKALARSVASPKTTSTGGSQNPQILKVDDKNAKTDSAKQSSESQQSSSKNKDHPPAVEGVQKSQEGDCHKKGTHQCNGKSKTISGGSNVKSSGGCQMPGVCGKCSKPGKLCSKNAEKHLATIARLGLSKYNQRCNRTTRCSDANGKPASKCHYSCVPKPDDHAKTPCDGQEDDCELDDTSSQEDTSSTRSNSTCTSSAHKDPKHCDCCYCEVFGHAVPTVAPVSRNYQEMRERLRLRLKMKKKIKPNAPVTSQQPKEVASPSNNVTFKTAPAPSPVGSQIPTTTPRKKEEDLNSLLQFIEGNIKDECLDEKKLAKRARQKQKKQEEKEERERLEREAERQRLEALKQLSRKNKKAAKKERQREAAASVKTMPDRSLPTIKLKPCFLNSNQVDTKSQTEKAEPKMVTIRRVMEPFGAEPTVTITIKSTTPEKEKLLFSLKNDTKSVGAQASVSKASNEGKKKKTRNKVEMDLSDVPAVHKKRVLEILKESNKRSDEASKKSAPGRITTASTKTTPSEVQLNSKTTNKTNHGKMSVTKESLEISVKAKPTQKEDKSQRKLKPRENLNVGPGQVTVSPAGPPVNGRPVFRLSQVLDSIPPSLPPVKEEIKLEDLRLPPGITITKIETPKPKVTRLSDDPGPVTKPVPMPVPLVVAHGAPPRQANQLKPSKSQAVSDDNVIVVDTSRLTQVLRDNGIQASPTDSKKKKGKNKNIQQNTENSHPDVSSSFSQQATIIKTSNNMVTIRSPQLQRAIEMQEASVNGLTGRLQGLHMENNGQLSKKMAQLTISEPATSGSADQSGKKKKKRRGVGIGSEDDGEQPENVFKPKDIDLESGEMDDDERELEAFKRFCLQSVPSARKDKVKVNLNIKDIVLKKKSSAIGCS